MKNNISVSVCMITYNHEPYIRKAIEGVLMQQCNFPYELVIGEDCGTDNTRKICQEYSAMRNEVKLLPSTMNLGMGQNFIRTVQACTGKYIAICEGDDYWTDPKKLQKQVDFLEAHPEFGLVHSDIDFVNTKGESLGEDFPGYQKIIRRITDGYVFDRFLSSHFVMTVSSLFRRELIDLDQLNPRFIYDFWIFTEVSRKALVYFIPEKLAAYRVHQMSVMRSNPGLIARKRPAVILDQIYRYYHRSSENLQVPAKAMDTKKSILLAFTRIFTATFFKININDIHKIFYIIYKKPYFLIMVPLTSVKLLYKRMF